MDNSKIQKLSEDLANLFLVNDYKWKFDYGLANPDANDIEMTLTKACEILRSQPDSDVQMEVGRLILKKRDGLIDIFVMMGTIDDD